jgi:hypothetical protein
LIGKHDQISGGRSRATDTFTPQAFHYRVDWRARGMSATAHKTRNRGAGVDFNAYVPFLDYPDPRRLDLRASLRTIPRQYLVRSYHERGAINVCAVADISGSMRYVGSQNKTKQLAEIVASIAWSANLTGDSFAFHAADDNLRRDLSVFPNRQRQVAQQVHASLLMHASLHAEIMPQGAAGLPIAAAQCGYRRSLVFLISDFHIEDDLLAQTADMLAVHDVIPIVLWDATEYQDVPEWGWARLRDMESGEERSMFMRRHLAENLRSAYRLRKLALQASGRRFGWRAPFFVDQQFVAEKLTRHILEPHAERQPL